MIKNSFTNSISSFHSVDILFIATGLTLSVLSYLLYYLMGYQPFILVLWVTGLVIFSAHFYKKRQKNSSLKILTKHDLMVILTMLCLFTPIYLWGLYYAPYQINTDELVVLVSTTDLLSKKYPIDIMGIMGFGTEFEWPTLIFLIFGWMCKLLGGIDWVHIRTVHSLFGLLTLIPAYIFFRLFWSRLYAAGATILLLTNHAFIGISRIAMINNTVILNEMAAFSLLYIGLKRQCPFYSFMGGLVAGLSFYHYFPARLIFILWIMFIFAITLFPRNNISISKIKKATLIGSLGFILVIMPQIISGLEHRYEYGYVKMQLLAFSEGRNEEKIWYGSSSDLEVFKRNSINGLTMFNRKIPDQQSIYFNSKSGIVDPLTGLLIWVGLLFIIFKRHKTPMDILAVGSFLFLLFVFMFFVNKTPAYCRILIILPFVVYIVIEGSKGVISLISKLLQRINSRYLMTINMKNRLFCLVIITIVCWNGIIYGAFLRDGFLRGDAIGGIVRYIELRKPEIEHTFYFPEDNIHTMLSDYFNYWLAYVLKQKDESSRRAFNTDDDPYIFVGLKTPFTVFLFKDKWNKYKGVFRKNYPAHKLHKIADRDSLFAFEVLDENSHNN